MHAVESQSPQAAGAHLPASAHLEERNHRLEQLVGELLKANQELRFKVALLERPTPDLEPGPQHSMQAG